MRRTSEDWGLPNGLDDPLARELLTALRERAAGTEGDEVQRDRPTRGLLKALRVRVASTAGEEVGRKGFGGEPPSSFSDHIRELMSRTGQSEARLADDLAHDIKVWAPYRAIMQALSQAKTGTQRTRRSAPPPGVLGRRVARGRLATNLQGGHSSAATHEAVESAKPRDEDGNSNARAIALTRPSRAAASTAADGATSASPSQAADTAAPSRPARATNAGAVVTKTTSKPGPKPGAVARYLAADRRPIPRHRSADERKAYEPVSRDGSPGLARDASRNRHVH